MFQPKQPIKCWIFTHHARPTQSCAYPTASHVRVVLNSARKHHICYQIVSVLNAKKARSSPTFPKQRLIGNCEDPILSVACFSPDCVHPNKIPTHGAQSRDITNIYILSVHFKLLAHLISSNTSETKYYLQNMPSNPALICGWESISWENQKP